MEIQSKYFNYINELSILTTNKTQHCDTKIINTELETFVIKNNSNVVSQLLKNGMTIFSSFDNRCNKICNGYYILNGINHPITCDSNCKKTCLYYGLINNYLSYKTIYKSLYLLQYLEPGFRIPCSCCNYQITNTNDDFVKIREIIIFICKEFKQISCDCDQKYNLCFGYKENYLHFITVYKFLNDKLKELYDNIINYYSIDMLNNFEFKLDNFNECIHVLVGKTISNCKNITNPIIDNVNINEVIFALTQSILFYLENVKILKLLFNQQAYEIYQFTLDKKNNDEIIEVIDNLFKLSEITDINYVNTFTGDTLIDITVEKADLCNVITHLFNYGTIVSKNLLKSSLMRSFYCSSIELYKNSLHEHKLCTINEMTLFVYIMTCDMSHFYKTEFLKNIIEDIDITQDHPIDVILAANNSEEYLNIILAKQEIKSLICPQHICHSIVAQNYNTLKILFDNGADPNGDYLNNIPLIACVNVVDDDEPLNMLSLILSLNPDLDLRDENGNSALHLAAKYGKINTLNILISEGANVFNLNTISGNSVLMTAIKYDQYDVVSSLIFCEKNNIQLVNVANNLSQSPLISSLDSICPMRMFSMLKLNSNIDYDYIDTDGNNILFHIVGHKFLTQKTKNVLFSMIYNMCDIKKTNVKNNTPIIVKATIDNQFYIVRLILNKLYLNNDISAEFANNMEFFLKNGICNNINIISNNENNIYNLIIQYVYVTEKCNKNHCDNDSEKSCQINFKNVDNINEYVKISINIILLFAKLILIVIVDKILYNMI